PDEVRPTGGGTGRAGLGDPTKGSAAVATRRSSLGPWLMTRQRSAKSGAKTLAARATRGGVWILHLEAAVLQRVEVVQLTARDVEGALGVHDHADAAGFYEDVAAGRPVLQIHLVLQARAAPAHDGDTEHPVGSALAGEQRTDLLGGAGRDFD